MPSIEQITWYKWPEEAPGLLIPAYVMVKCVGDNVAVFVHHSIDSDGRRRFFSKENGVASAGFDITDRVAYIADKPEGPSE